MVIVFVIVFIFVFSKGIEVLTNTHILIQFHMMDHQNQYLKNGYHLVKINNGKNSKKFTTRINGYHFDKHSNCCWN